MAKAEERGTASSKPNPSPGEGATISPEDAERAAAAFSPLWQLDEAPFKPGPDLPAAEVQALAAPPGVMLDPRQVSASATAPAAPLPVPAPTPSPPVVSDPSKDRGVTEADLVPDDSPTAGDAALNDMPRVLHQPISARPAEPVLPSVIVAESEPVLPPSFTPAAPADVAPAAPADVAAPAVVVEKAASEGPREVEPAITREKPATRVGPPAAAPVEDYQVPRSRLPLVLGWGALGCVVVGLAVYFVGAARSGHRAAPGVSAGIAHTAPVAAVTIPLPPPADETPPTPPAASAPPAEAATAAAAAPVAAGTTAPQVTEPTPPPRRTPSQAAETKPAPPRVPRSPRPKTPSPAPAPGNIVRVNPF